MKTEDFKINGKWSFCRVKCKGYMKKVNDGRFIFHNVEGWWYADNNTGSIETWTEKIEDIPTNKEFVCKDPEETVQCIVVYYAQNKSRLVLFDDIELDGETCIIKAKDSKMKKKE